MSATLSPTDPNGPSPRVAEVLRRLERTSHSGTRECSAFRRVGDLLLNFDSRRASCTLEEVESRHLGCVLIGLAETHLLLNLKWTTGPAFSEQQKVYVMSPSLGGVPSWRLGDEFALGFAVAWVNHCFNDADYGPLASPGAVLLETFLDVWRVADRDIRIETLVSLSGVIARCAAHIDEVHAQAAALARVAPAANDPAPGERHGQDRQMALFDESDYIATEVEKDPGWYCDECYEHFEVETMFSDDHARHCSLNLSKTARPSI